MLIDQNTGGRVPESVQRDVWKLVIRGVLCVIVSDDVFEFFVSFRIIPEAVLLVLLLMLMVPAERSTSNQSRTISSPRLHPENAVMM